jgi:hypothetical protein
MMGPWVPPPTPRAPTPCQITSAIPGHIALEVTPNTALGGPQTAERPQPRGWVRGVRSVRGLPTERKPVDLAKHRGDSGGFGLRLAGVEPLVGIVAAEGRQTGFNLITRIPHTHRNKITDQGLHAAMYLSAVHDRFLPTGPARLTDQIASPPLGTASHAYQTAPDNLTRTTGLAA